MSNLISDEELVERFGHLGVDRDSAEHFRARLDRRLTIQRCADCGRYHHPPGPICPACWSMHVRAEKVSGNGIIYLTIFLHQGPPAAGVDYATPYPVVTVELDEQPGLRFTATVVDSPNEEIRIGRRVELGWIDRAGVPTPVFRLLPEADS